MLMGRRHVSVLAWCAACAEKVQMVTPAEAALLGHVSQRTIYRWIEAEKLHFTETPEGLLMICINSLQTRMY